MKFKEKSQTSETEKMNIKIGIESGYRNWLFDTSEFKTLRKDLQKDLAKKLTEIADKD